MAYVPNINGVNYLRGADALKRFHTASRSLFPNSVNYSYEELIGTLTKRTGQIAFVDSLGFAINSVGFSNSRVQSAMYSLAQKAQGKIPSKNGDFFNHLQNEGYKINFVDAVTFVTKESVKDIVTGAQAIGDSIITTGKIFNFLLPAIVGVVVYFWVMKQK